MGKIIDKTITKIVTEEVSGSAFIPCKFKKSSNS